MEERAWSGYAQAGAATTSKIKRDRGPMEVSGGGARNSTPGRPGCTATGRGCHILFSSQCGKNTLLGVGGR